MLIFVCSVVSDVLSAELKVTGRPVLFTGVIVFPFCDFYSIIYRKQVIKFEPYKG